MRSYVTEAGRVVHGGEMPEGASGSDDNNEKHQSADDEGSHFDQDGWQLVAGRKAKRQIKSTSPGYGHHVQVSFANECMCLCRM